MSGGTAGSKTLRELLWTNGYRPVAIRNGCKFPTDTNWGDRAKQNPPACISEDASPTHLGTGVITAGLRAIDVDIADPTMVHTIVVWCLDNLGPAPIRFRDNAVRMLLVYRAAVGEPTKAKVWNSDTRQGVEVLGDGQQFHAYGVHPDTGAILRWADDVGPHNLIRADLTAITEDQVSALLNFAQPFVGEAKPRERPTIARTLANRPATFADPQDVEIEDVENVLNAISKVGLDYDDYFAIAAAVYSATNGSGEGLALLSRWSDDAAVKTVWRALERKSPSIRFGTLVFYARQSDPTFWPKWTDDKSKSLLERARDRIKFEQERAARRRQRFRC